MSWVPPTKTFEPSLFVRATVMSRPAEDSAIVDAGLRALALDSGPPLVCDESAATYERDRLETRRVFSWSPASLAAVKCQASRLAGPVPAFLLAYAGNPGFMLSSGNRVSGIAVISATAHA